MLIQPLTPEIIEKRRDFRRHVLGVPGCIWRKTWRGILWTMVVLFIAHSALNIYASVLLNRELASIRQKGEPLQFSELEPPAVPNAQNAALIYAQATKSLLFSPAEKAAFATPKSDRTTPINGDIEAALAKNQKSLDLVRRASLMTQCRFPLDYGTANLMSSQFPYYKELRELARLLAAQASLEAKNHDPAAALRDVRGIFGISYHLSSEPSLLGFLVAQSIDGVGHQTLAQVLENAPLNAIEANEFEASLPKNDWNRALHQSLLGDRTLSILGFESLPVVFGDTSPLWASYPLLLLWNPAIKMDEVQTLHLWRQQFDAASTLQFRAFSNFNKTLDQAIQSTPRYAVMTRILMPSFVAVGHTRDAGKVRQYQRQIALALAVYRTSKGRYPAQLQELAVFWQKPLPLDPYSQKPFVYRREGKSFVLYSIGVDRVDNGGKNRYSTGHAIGSTDDDLAWPNAKN